MKNKEICFNVDLHVMHRECSLPKSLISINLKYIKNFPSHATGWTHG